MMRPVRQVLVLGGIVVLLVALGFIFQMEWATRLWPWPDGRLSYIFVGSIQAAVAVAMIWIGMSADWRSLGAGALNILVMMGGIAAFFFMESTRVGASRLLGYAAASALATALALALFVWASRRPVAGSPPLPPPVRVSFGLFVLLLLLAGGALVRQQANVMPWPLKPETSVLFGWIFIGDAFYFLYGLLKPGWHNARTQLWSFLTYDLVLIGPFLAHFATVPSELRFNLVLYIAVLLYSGALASYYLFVNPLTRLSRSELAAAPV